jgi:2,5-diketo-D-gluconate reductase B
MPPRDLPPIAYGTAYLDEYDDGSGIVAEAVDVGYRFFDTATAYGTEEIVAEGLERAGIDPDDVVIATKVGADDLGYEDAIASAEGSRERLGVETIDLLYVHWPFGAYDPEGTLRAFDELRDRGVIEHVGLSNFTPALLGAARDRLDAPVLAHQFEMHPLLQQRELVACAREHDHYAVAHGPMIKGRIFDVPELQPIAEKHGITPAQVGLAWLSDRARVIPIAATGDPDHLRSNYDAASIELDDEDHERIAAIDREHRSYPDPVAVRRDEGYDAPAG